MRCVRNKKKSTKRGSQEFKCSTRTSSTGKLRKRTKFFDPFDSQFIPFQTRHYGIRAPPRRLRSRYLALHPRIPLAPPDIARARDAVGPGHVVHVHAADIDPLVVTPEKAKSKTVRFTPSGAGIWAARQLQQSSGTQYGNAEAKSEVDDASVVESVENSHKPSSLFYTPKRSPTIRAVQMTSETRMDNELMRKLNQPVENNASRDGVEALLNDEERQEGEVQTVDENGNVGEEGDVEETEVGEDDEGEVVEEELENVTEMVDEANGEVFQSATSQKKRKGKGKGKRTKRYSIG